MSAGRGANQKPPFTRFFEKKNQNAKKIMLKILIQKLFLNVAP
jgi:hypothetical protein